MTVINLRTNEEITINENMRLICALGNFDGVHMGHAKLLRFAASKPGDTTHSAVWTFRKHPGVCKGNENARILTSIEQKANIFRSYGIDLMILNNFEEVSSLSPEEFAIKELYEKCNVRAAVCGFNFRFGKNAAGTAGILADILSNNGAAVHVFPPLMNNDKCISSTSIRDKIEAGNVEDARTMLGHPFSIFLPVTEGRKLGRTINVPTINQNFPKYYAIPKHGVYACRCIVDGTSYIAISNVGVRPTVTGGNATVNCETHIIDFSDWLYGKKVQVDFYKFLRPEIRFESLEKLKIQIESDILETRKYFKK